MTTEVPIKMKNRGLFKNENRGLFLKNRDTTVLSLYVVDDSILSCLYTLSETCF